jgi:archaellum component FlaC
MNEADKIEDLRRDVHRLFVAFNGVAKDIERIWSHLNRIDSKLNEVAKAVEVLEDVLPKAKKGRKK